MSVEQPGSHESEADFTQWQEELDQTNPDLPVEAEVLDHNPPTSMEQSPDARIDRARSDIIAATPNDQLEKISDRPGQTDARFVPEPDHTAAVHDKEQQWAANDNKKGLSRLVSELGRNITRAFAPRRRP